MPWAYALDQNSGQRGVFSFNIEKLSTGFVFWFQDLGTLEGVLEANYVSLGSSCTFISLIVSGIVLFDEKKAQAFAACAPGLHAFLT
jgi:hypothetical protein